MSDAGQPHNWPLLTPPIPTPEHLAIPYDSSFRFLPGFEDAMTPLRLTPRDFAAPGTPLSTFTLAGPASVAAIKLEAPGPPPASQEAMLPPLHLFSGPPSGAAAAAAAAIAPSAAPSTAAAAAGHQQLSPPDVAANATTAGQPVAATAVRMQRLGEIEDEVASLELNSYKLCKYRKYEVSLTVRRGWRVRHGLSEVDLLQALLSAKCCRLGSSTPATCDRCTADRVVALTATSQWPVRRDGSDTETYTCAVQSKCTSSRDHLRSTLVLLIDTLPFPHAATSEPFSLLARDKGKRLSLSLRLTQSTFTNPLHLPPASKGKRKSSLTSVGSSLQDEDDGGIFGAIPAKRQNQTDSSPSPGAAVGAAAAGSVVSAMSSLLPAPILAQLSSGFPDAAILGPPRQQQRTQPAGSTPMRPTPSPMSTSTSSPHSSGSPMTPLPLPSTGAPILTLASPNAVAVDSFASPRSDFSSMLPEHFVSGFLTSKGSSSSSMERTLLGEPTAGTGSSTGTNQPQPGTK